jgi:hypothetical protein
MGADGVNHSQHELRKLTGRWGSLLDACERLIDEQHVGKVFRALGSEFVAPDAAKSKLASMGLTV